MKDFFKKVVRKNNYQIPMLMMNSSLSSLSTDSDIKSKCYDVLAKQWQIE